MLAAVYKFILFAIWLGAVFCASMIIAAMKMPAMVQIILFLWVAGFLGWVIYRASTMVSLTWGRMS